MTRANGERNHTLRALYVHKGLTVLEAAARVDYSYRNAQRIKAKAKKDGDDWDEARAASLMTQEGMSVSARDCLERFLRMYNVVFGDLEKDENITPLEKAETISRLADAFTKTMNAVGKASPRLSKLAMATDVLQRLAGYLREHKPEIAHVFAEVLEDFSADLAKAYGT